LYSFVIPAQAGIQNVCKQLLWVMQLDSRLRENDGVLN
jgi:hypothetical protein